MASVQVCERAYLGYVRQSETRSFAAKPGVLLGERIFALIGVDQWRAGINHADNEGNV